jgi:alkaline phosphatase D
MGIIWLLILPMLSMQLHITEDLVHRIALGSCFNPRRGHAIWSTIESYRPDQLLLLGDQIYVDKELSWMNRKPSPMLIATEYKQVVSSSQWQSLQASISGNWMAVFDDHDYGINNGDKTFHYRNESIALFKHFYPAFQAQLVHNRTTNSPHEVSDQKEGVFSSSSFTVPLPGAESFTYKVILLDVRSNKDPAHTANGDFLGAQQWAWLQRELSEDSDPVDLVLLGSPIQVLPTDKLLEESWGDFPEQRNKLLQLLAITAQRSNLLLLSGDVHSAEISQARCRTRGRDGEAEVSLVELTSSGLSHTLRHSATPSGEARRNSWLLDWLSGLYEVAHPAHYRRRKYADLFRSMHFALLDLHVQRDTATATAVFRVISHTGQEVMQQAFPLPHSLHAKGPVDSTSDGIFECEPVQGGVAVWRVLLMRAVVLLFVAITVLLPALLTLYLLGASLYYLCMGAELRRRQRLTLLHQKRT